MNAKKIVLAGMSAALIAGAAIPALAAPGNDGPRRPHGPPPHGAMMGPMMQDMLFVRLLKKADTNKDGKISKDEFTAYEQSLFTEIDGNKDGLITRGELVDYRDAKIAEFRKNNPPPAPPEADGKGPPAGDQAANQDGKGPGPGPDGDRPGHHHRDGGPRDARWGHGPGPMGHGPMMGGPGMERGLFRMVDENHDRKISKEEAAQAADTLFARLDTNKDGQISIDDLPDRPF